ncbi:MAG TPA: SapC family protein [Acetobacteraceae bacterium]|nr:SapC family protein [Acetobacteraceae bacterium]
MSATADAKALPLFYRQVRMLNTVRDQDLCLMPPSDYTYAAETNAIPLVAEEFFRAQAHYPIVFSGTESPLPVAVVGLRNNENLFIDADGAWRADCYLPLYVRRHPFIFIKGDDTSLHLGVDPTSPRLGNDRGQRLFEANQPSALTRGLLEFCSGFARQHDIAAALGAALQQNALLVDYRFDVTAAGLAHRVGGCRVVSEDKLNALPDDVFLEFRRAGWLPMITAHLLSLRQWEALGRLAVQRSPASLAA